MKKLSIVLLVLALAGGSAFAADVAISGDATFSTSFDIDAVEGGFDANVYGLEYDFEIVLVPGADASAMGEGDTYVVLEVSVDDVTLAGDESTAPAISNPGAVSVDTFKVVSGDLTIDLLGGMDSFGYAEYDPDDDDDTVDAADAAAGALTGANGGIGVEVNGLTLGADFWYDGAVTAFVSAKYSADLAEGAALNLAAGWDTTDGADVAAQLVYDGDIDVTVGFDAANNFSAMDLEVEAAVEFGNVSTVIDAYTDFTDYFLTVANTIALDTIDLGLDVELDTLADAIVVGADFATTVDAVALAVDGGVSFDTAFALTAWDAGAKATYSMDSADVYVDVNLASGITLMVEVGAESSSMIDGATTSLVWASGDLLSAALGTITAAISVSL